MSLNSLNYVYLSRSKISVRSLSPVKDGSAIVLGIPGGPSISSAYMDEPTSKLASDNRLNGAVIELPNHGKSGRVSQAGLTFTYTDARPMLLSLIKEFNDRGIKVILYGHSFGALVAMDLFRSREVTIEKCILVSAPTAFESRPEFHEFLKNEHAAEVNWATEGEFEKWWRKVLPAYFIRSLMKTELDVLSKPTFLIGNENYQENAPRFSEIAADLVKQNKVGQMTYFEGEKEWVLPECNFDRVLNALPGLNAFRVPRTGHFPMLDDKEFIPSKVSKDFSQFPTKD